MKKIKQPLRNLFVVAAIAIVVSSCEDWLDFKDDDHNFSFKGETVAGNLDTPWELAFAPDGRLFLTQRPGIVTVVDNGKSHDWLKLDSVAVEVQESGLTGITLHPDFASNGYVYVNYTYALSKSPLKLVNRIVRYKEDPSTKAPKWDKVILDGVDGNYLHNIGALEFGPDGMLYATSGDHYSPELAQQTESLNGKILRIGPDGEVPSDNPIAGSFVYSYGHRNPQGIAFHPTTNALWETEHGPSLEQGCCMDEINVIEKNGNYGWPLIRGKQMQEGLKSPVYYSGDTTTWAPVGGIFIKHGDWAGSFVFTGLRGQALYRAVIDSNDPNKVTKVERYLHNILGRLRNVAEDKDGNLYLAVSNQDGRGLAEFDQDRVLKFTTEEIKKLGMDETGMKVE
ncbi:MAG TPA: PQQ-dependent sugar dehydrogenase [Cyclobacteriaceae bacterium]|nr:PQQ-dependent sugar dehydrogenase [Cyclobacteriaceae bacterium]